MAKQKVFSFVRFVAMMSDKCIFREKRLGNTMRKKSTNERKIGRKSSRSQSA